MCNKEFLLKSRLVLSFRYVMVKKWLLNSSTVPNRHVKRRIIKLSFYPDDIKILLLLICGGLKNRRKFFH